MPFAQTYFPNHDQNLMSGEGDVEKAREFFLQNRPNNLVNLLKNRYAWMSNYIEKNQKAIELGCGAGFGPFFISNKKLVLTDVLPRSYTELTVNALNMPFENSSVDVLICSHMIHHLANPVTFFNEAARVLKPNGYLLIQEINTSFLMRLLLRAMRHEGWSYDVDVFDEKITANDPRDPWSANCAIPELLFRDNRVFETRIKHFKVEKNELCECLAFPLSGGVIARTFSIPLPNIALKMVNFIDNVLVKCAPGLFALGRSVVLRKIG